MKKLIIALIVILSFTTIFIGCGYKEVQMEYLKTQQELIKAKYGHGDYEGKKKKGRVKNSRKNDRIEKGWLSRLKGKTIEQLILPFSLYIYYIYFVVEFL